MLLSMVSGESSTGLKCCCSSSGLNCSDAVLAGDGGSIACGGEIAWGGENASVLFQLFVSLLSVVVSCFKVSIKTNLKELTNHLFH